MTATTLEWRIVHPGLLHIGRAPGGDVFWLARVPGEVDIGGTGPRFVPDGGGWAPRYAAEELLEGWELHFVAGDWGVVADVDTWQAGRRRAAEMVAAGAVEAAR